MHTDPSQGLTARPPGCRDAAQDDADAFRRTFRADPHDVRDTLRGAVARFARAIPDDAAGALELALAEVLNNIAEHAYAGLPAGPVELELTQTSDALQCRIVDYGHPMPGLSLPKGEMQAVAEEVADLAEGGWGWALIRTLTTSLDYSRDRDTNLLTFSVPLSAE